MSGSGKEQASSAIWVAVGQIDLPDKKYFKIGEVAHLVGVEPHVLRYWQTQFSQVRPHKSRSGHRLYRRKDVETLLAVKELLHVQRFTIAGARQALKNAVVHKGDTSIPPVDVADTEPPRESPRNETAAKAPVDGASDGGLQAVEVVGLDGEALSGALEKELAARKGATVELPLEVQPAQARAQEGEGAAGAAEVPLAEVRPSGNGHAESSEPAEDRRSSAASSPASLELAFSARAGSDRQGLIEARREVLAMLELLDREDAKDRRRAPAL